ncbi:hypothetical protein BN439_1017 [Erwinia amylovora Ea644]|uniref:hypothetical protein n=1 Tax=Erwinia amylovora TaxID=552 RepID=UPI0002CC6148|nr:hypothetical protein [Erwinia amylovora]CCP02102.1 hypothetical protein BN439_1017 [Erwinia amylovora Ea644]CCP06131.1 hypothetical protein BN440_1082 [Erwinia amylovora MR1]
MISLAFGQRTRQQIPDGFIAVSLKKLAAESQQAAAPFNELRRITIVVALTAADGIALC